MFFIENFIKSYKITLIIGLIFRQESGLAKKLKSIYVVKKCKWISTEEIFISLATFVEPIQTED